MINEIKYINIAITDRCNLKCAHCDIWQKKKKNEIPLSLIKKVFDSGPTSKEVDIALTGGEPFLYNKFGDLIKLMLNKRATSLKTISTNGTLKGKILRFLKEFYAYLPSGFALHVSFDGISHYQKQRNALPKEVLSCLYLIKKYYPDIPIKLKFTITPLNYTDIIPTYKFATRNGLGFKIKLVEQALTYTNSIMRKAFFFEDDARKKIAADLYHLRNNEKLITTQEADFIGRTIGLLNGTNQKLPCKTPLERIFIMPTGLVYSCLHLKQIGDLKKTKLAFIWNSKQNKENRIKAANRNCVGCVAYHGYGVS